MLQQWRLVVWNRGGNADSVGVDNNSSINTGSGNDSVVVNSFAQVPTPMPGLFAIAH